MTVDTLTKDESIRLMQAEIERLRGLLQKCQVVLNQVAETTLAADVMYEDIDKAIGRKHCIQKAPGE